MSNHEHDEAVKEFHEVILESLDEIIELGEGEAIGFTDAEGQYTYNELLVAVKEKAPLGTRFLAAMAEDLTKDNIRENLKYAVEEEIEKGNGDEPAYIDANNKTYTYNDMSKEIKKGSDVANLYLDETTENIIDAPYKEDVEKIIASVTEEEQESIRQLLLILLELPENSTAPMEYLLDESVGRYRFLVETLNRVIEDKSLIDFVEMMRLASRFSAVSRQERKWKRRGLIGLLKNIRDIISKKNKGI